ncbi:MAG: GDSL-type esterase/lipase family protein [Parvibaculum sp.]|nr:GDSL-type esterase/lipase family protein [Parvibaculum sp.]
MIGVGPVPRADPSQGQSLMGRLRPALLASAALMVLAVAACAATPCSPSLSAPTSPAGLNKFYAALDGLKSGTATHPVTVLHLGDSHIALDHMTGVLRQKWVTLFGDAGRGLPAGVPYPYFSPRGFKVSMTSDWTIVSSLKAGVAGPFGIAGFRIEASNATARISLVSDTPVDGVEIEAYGGPQSGSLSLTLGNAAPLRLSTRRATPGVVFLRLPAAQVRDVVLMPQGDGPVTLLGWSMLKSGAGLRYDSYGISGATLDVVSHWDEAIVDEEIARLAPDLILLGYGTNEGFNDNADVAAYTRRYEALATRLERLAPHASIVTLGAVDGARRARPADRQTCGDGFAVPPKLAVLREAQRGVMRARGHGFVDLSAAMGGPCGISQWVQADPPLAWPDHVHLRKSGAETVGRFLWHQLMQPFETAVCLSSH